MLTFKKSFPRLFSIFFKGQYQLVRPWTLLNGFQVMIFPEVSSRLFKLRVKHKGVDHADHDTIRLGISRAPY
jgi:hypothetical protein